MFKVLDPSIAQLHDNNDYNRLFMAPHLVRAQSAYKDIRKSSFHQTYTFFLTRTHTHTNTCITGDGLVQSKENDKSVCRRDEFSVLI